MSKPTFARRATRTTPTAAKTPVAANPAKPLADMAAEEVIAELRALPRQEQAEAYWSAGSGTAASSAATRARGQLYAGLCRAVAMGRDGDLPALSRRWDHLRRLSVRAANGKPAEWRAENAALALREACPSADALHEAAHAVAARALGAHVEEVSILRGAGPAYMTAHGAHLTVDARMKILVAPAEAALLAGGSDERGCRNDFEQAREILRDVGTTESAATTRIQQSRAAVRVLLVDHVGELIATARALDKRGYLDAEDLRAIPATTSARR